MTQNQNLALFANNITTANNTGLYYAGIIATGNGGGSATGGITVSSSNLVIGNSTVNVSTNSTHFFAGNSTVYGLGNSTAEGVLSSNASGTNYFSNVIMTTSTLNLLSGNSSAANAYIYTNVTSNTASLILGSSGVNTFVTNATGVYITGSLNPIGNSSVIAAILTNAAESSTVSATAANGTINYDVTTQGVLYYTSNAANNWTVNFRGSSGTSLNTLMATNQSMTVAFLVTQGASAYYANAHQIDGNAVTPKWQGGTAPTAGNASGIDIYTYTIVKTASNTYTILASQTQFA